uniref:hypothetical protein n=1 Tax=uncultured Prevotella sp. TaxID=159272 RepID=UPI0025F6BFC3
TAVKEEQLDGLGHADMILTMGRLDSTLRMLEQKQQQGTTVINSPHGVRSCARANIDRVMRSNGIPVAPLTGNCGYWIKRGDEAAQSKEDVVFAADEAEKDKKIEAFAARGIKNIVVTAHVKGDLVKFYGVRGTGFFKTYYPGDDGMSKFGDELVNGKPAHYDFDTEKLKADAEKTAELIDIDIYGGDCIIREDGSYAIIDFNDWPSFSRCREEAADAMADVICKKM